jgi:hypothetical protein
VPETPLDAQKRKEAQRRFDQLTKRIEALDVDIGRSNDSEHTLTAQQARSELARQRDMVASELSALGWGIGDRGEEEIREKIADLLSALDGKQPEKAHKILSEIVTIDTRMQAAECEIKNHDGRITAIEKHIHPAPLVNALRVVAFFVVLLGIALAGFQYPVFSLYPFLGLIVEGALIVLAGVILLYANAIQERRQ